MPNVFVPQKFFPQHITGFSSSSNKKNNEELLYFLEPSLQKMMETFQKILSSHYENSGQTLHNVADMRNFSEIYAPGLFDVRLSSILRDDSRLQAVRRKENTAGTKNSCSSPCYDDLF